MTAATPTEKLYWNDAFESAMRASSIRVATFGDRPSVVLDRTVFYPESGGQLGDRGVLTVGDTRLVVVDTQVDGTGVIHHVLDAPPPGLDAEGKVVDGVIDVQLRAAQRLQHSAQHMLSRALADVAEGPTVSARLGNQASTIDIGLERIDEAAVARAEDLVNSVIRDDLAVSAFFPSAAELAQLPLRRAPKVQKNVRVVAVGAPGAFFDVSPCGGTHVARTGQIGAVRVTGIERYKGMTRVTFLAGARTIEDARSKDRALGGLARELSCGPLDVAQAVLKMRGELKAEREIAGKLRAELAVFEAERLLSQNPERAPFTPIVARLDDGDPLRLRTLANRLTARPDVLAIVCGANEGATDAAIVVQRGTNVAADCGTLMKKLAAAHGGKGGGSPARAEGRLPASIPREALVNALAVAEA